MTIYFSCDENQLWQASLAISHIAERALPALSTSTITDKEKEQNRNMTLPIWKKLKTIGEWFRLPAVIVPRFPKIEPLKGGFLYVASVSVNQKARIIAVITTTANFTRRSCIFALKRLKNCNALSN